MRYFWIFAFAPFIFCSAQFKESKGLNSNIEIEPKELYAAFTSLEKEFLQKNGFFAQKSQYKKFSDLYKSLKNRSLPIYVTTDCVLHTYHILYDYSLRMLEMDYLYSEADNLTKNMITSTENLLKGKKGELKQALLDNLAYFEVAASLLNPDFEISESVENKVNKEISLISKAEGFEKSPIFEYKEDYSQYKPRGHYTRNEVLKRYFKTMMWYGRMAFRLNPDDDQENKKGKKETRRALLILEAAKDYFQDWNRINLPIILYVGKSDDLTMLEYFKIKSRVFPNKKPIEIAQDDEKLTIFINEAMKYRPPKIVSTAVADTEKPEIVTKGFKFFGQKFIPDSYMFQNLVYDKVGTQNNPRLFPMGLDVFAVLGSDRAREILIQTYKENRFANYESQMGKLIKEFEDITEKDWFFNLYWGWLYTMKSLLLPIPGFKPAYQDKCLQTALGTWAELRHDTILYAKQSYTALITAVQPRPQMIKGYVEPIPECFARLQKLVDMSKTELEKNAFLNKIVKQKFEQFSNLLDRLYNIAKAELENKELTDEDYDFIMDIGDALKNIESFPGADYTTETDESAALIVDVHTDPNTKQVLEVGNDVPAVFFIIINVNGRKQIFTGGIYDYYEFLQPMDKRLTDEEWQKLSLKPDKPEWIEYFSR
jgi:hypothetical protein